MEMSVREARAQFAAAIAAAERGERVTITKNGKVVAELGPPTSARAKWDWDKLDQIQERLGIPDGNGLDEKWRRSFDDPAFSREVLGLADDGKPHRP